MMATQNTADLMKAVSGLELTLKRFKGLAKG